MLRSVKRLLSAAAVCAFVAGCSLFVFEQREPWRDQAEAQCVSAGRFTASAYAARERAVSGPGACGMEYPFRISAFQNGAIALKSRGLLACPAASAFDKWLGEAVEPAARLYFGQSVTQLHTGTYNCRSMNNQRGAPRSEHSYGNAVDVMWIRLESGRIITVKDGWNGAPDEAAFLREIFVASCGYFNTVLAPGSDRYHADHFHLDLARHAKGRTICKPVIKFTPLLGRHPVAEGGLSVAPQQAWSAGEQMPAQQAPVAPFQEEQAEPLAALPPETGAPSTILDLY